MYPPCSSSNEIINDEFIQTLRNDFFSDNISGSNFNFLYTEVNNSALEVCQQYLLLLIKLQEAVLKLLLIPVIFDEETNQFLIEDSRIVHLIQTILADQKQIKEAAGKNLLVSAIDLWK